MKQDNFLYTINAKMATMSKSEKAVVSIILKAPNEVINMNMAKLAEISNVSEPTVVRVFNILNFKKFHDFKIRLAQAIVPMAPFVYDQVSKNDTVNDVIKKTCNNSINAIQMAEHEFNSTDIEQVVTAIAKAKFISILSSGLTEIVALDAEHKFSRLGIRCATVFRATQQLILSKNVTPNDALVIISQSGTTKRLIEVAEIAKKRQCTIICITAPDSPLATLCDYLIKVTPYERIETMTPLSSRFIHHILVNILVASLAISNGSDSPDQLPALDSWIDNKVPIGI